MKTINLVVPRTDAEQKPPEIKCIFPHSCPHCKCDGNLQQGAKDLVHWLYTTVRYDQWDAIVAEITQIQTK